jgi:hypothetical protein
VLVYLTFLKVTGSVVVRLFQFRVFALHESTPINFSFSCYLQANANVPGQSRMTRQEESLKMLIMNRNFKSGGCPDLC